MVSFFFNNRPISSTPEGRLGGSDSRDRVSIFLHFIFQELRGVSGSAGVVCRRVREGSSSGRMVQEIEKDLDDLVVFRSSTALLCALG
jgi:hypothetical protein